MLCTVTLCACLAACLVCSCVGILNDVGLTLERDTNTTVSFFLSNIPPSQPVLLIMDGHSSHVSIDVIQLARDTGIHLLCVPTHTTHILQPLDIGVFKSFKSNFTKACSKYRAAHPG